MIGMVDAIDDGGHRTGRMNIGATASLRNSGVNLKVKTSKPYCGICLQLALRDLLILKLIYVEVISLLSYLKKRVNKYQNIRIWT